MKAVIMAGGKGTRLAALNAEIPKPMFPVAGKPVLEYQIKSLRDSGITELVLIVGHLKDAIKDYFGDGQRFGVTISYIEEEKPLGTAGALYYLKREKEAFILSFGDLILDIDFNRFMRFHREKKAAVTLFGHPNTHPYDSDLIVADEHGLVERILGKRQKRPFYYHNFVNAGVYCVSPSALEDITAPVQTDLEKELIARLVKQHRVYAYRSAEYVKDMGTPERLRAVTEDLAHGVPSARSLRRRQRAVFLDRDGTINQYVGFLRRIEEFELLPGVGEAVAALNASPYLTIVATNQPVIARGEVSVQQLDEIHRKMETELGNAGAYLDDLFYCPHHPHRGYDGEIPALKIECACRKPRIGMLLRAAEKYHIDLSASWYIGDSTVDIQTGKNAGTKTILLKTGQAGLDGKYDVQADYTAASLKDAVACLLSRE